MLVRIVKLQFKEEKINDFLLHFETVKWEVTNFPGCRGMKLLQDLNTPCIIMTYSVWDDEKTLENYKNSALFKSIWPNIKVWFDAKPEAWSLETTFDGFKEIY
jgi:quinol monooxygenase YgiN